MKWFRLHREREGERESAQVERKVVAARVGSKGETTYSARARTVYTMFPGFISRHTWLEFKFVGSRWNSRRGLSSQISFLPDAAKATGPRIFPAAFPPSRIYLRVTGCLSKDQDYLRVNVRSSLRASADPANIPTSPTSAPAASGKLRHAKIRRISLLAWRSQRKLQTWKYLSSL